MTVRIWKNLNVEFDIVMNLTETEETTRLNLFFIDDDEDVMTDDFEMSIGDAFVFVEMMRDTLRDPDEPAVGVKFDNGKTIAMQRRGKNLALTCEGARFPDSLVIPRKIARGVIAELDDAIDEAQDHLALVGQPKAA